jgi:hypothetical protein
MIIKTEDSSFVRDVGSNALINSNIDAYKLYQQQRRQQKDRSNLQEQIDVLKNDLGDIKKMLSVLIQRENNGNNNI